MNEISIDATAVLFALACSLGASVFFGSIALLKSGRVRVAQVPERVDDPAIGVLGVLSGQRRDVNSRAER